MRFGVLFVALVGLAGASSARQAAPPPSPPPLHGPGIGDVIPSFDAPGMAGSAVHVEFPSGSKTVLIFFQASCPHCRAMIPLWNNAFERKPANLKVLGVLMDEPQADFFAALHVAFPVLHSPGRPFLHEIKVSSVPVTLRIGDGGKVVDAIIGQTDGLRVGELFAP